LSCWLHALRVLGCYMASCTAHRGCQQHHMSLQEECHATPVQRADTIALMKCGERSGALVEATSRTALAKHCNVTQNHNGASPATARNRGMKPLRRSTACLVPGDDAATATTINAKYLQTTLPANRCRSFLFFTPEMLPRQLLRALTLLVAAGSASAFVSSACSGLPRLQQARPATVFQMSAARQEVPIAIPLPGRDYTLAGE
jgi:hypothetical protein